MKNIVVLVDFTETANVSVAQAIVIARTNGAKIHLCHVFGADDADGGPRSSKFDPYKKKVEDQGISCSIAAAEGDLVFAVKTVVKEVDADLVVIGTHGKHGAKQNKYGAHIYNLVKRIPVPCLVVSDTTKVNDGGFKKIMMPVGSHDNYLWKVKQACAIGTDAANILIFTIADPGHPLEPKIQENIDATVAEIGLTQVGCDLLVVDPTVHSIGYSHETLAYLKDHKMDLIVILTEVYKDNRHFGTIDKENLILNTLGLPVLCC